MGDKRYVRLFRAVRGDWPVGHDVVAEPGIYEANVNAQGAVSVMTPRGELGLKPGEFEWCDRFGHTIVPKVVVRGTAGHEWLDPIRKAGSDTIMLAVDTGGGYRPIRVCLTHQVYLRDLQDLWRQYPNAQGFYVIPISSADWELVAKIEHVPTPDRLQQQEIEQAEAAIRRQIYTMLDMGYTEEYVDRNYRIDTVTLKLEERPGWDRSTQRRPLLPLRG